MRSPGLCGRILRLYALPAWRYEELQQWRGAIQQEIGTLESSRSIDDLDIGSMIWFTITDEKTDQTPPGKGNNLLVGNGESSV